MHQVTGNSDDISSKQSTPCIGEGKGKELNVGCERIRCLDGYVCRDGNRVKLDCTPMRQPCDRGEDFCSANICRSYGAILAFIIILVTVEKPTQRCKYDSHCCGSRKCIVNSHYRLGKCSNAKGYWKNNSFCTISSEWCSKIFGKNWFIGRKKCRKPKNEQCFRQDVRCDSNHQCCKRLLCKRICIFARNKCN